MTTAGSKRPNGRAGRGEALADLLSLAGQTVLVTGAASGIGRATSLRLAEAGSDLVLVDRDLAGLEALAAELEPTGRAVTVRALDLADPAAIDALWRELASRPPDALVNNAGVYVGRAFDAVDDDSYRAAVGVNLDAVYRMCQRFVAARAGRGGRIVNVGSVEAVLPFKDDMATYSMCKAAVIALTRALAREYARKGIRANVVVPGGIVTPGTKRMAREVLRGNVGLVKTGYDFMQRLPAGRFGTPDEVARVVLFLCSELSAYMHGAVVAVDGGFLSA